MAAAVADWRPANPASRKLKKTAKHIVLRLEPAPDVLRSVSRLKGDRVFVGFAAETGNPLAEAMRKMRVKKLDLMVANDVSAPDAGFDVDTNRVSLLAPGREREDLPLMSKREVAERILDRVEAFWAGRRGGARSERRRMAPRKAVRR
jgi:phosphopantothenoylcysteine decarboxylase/phosphopantothenate--cysteine ligase